MKKCIYLLIAASCCIFGCKQPEQQQLVQQQHYKNYLTPSAKKSGEANVLMDFWMKRLADHPGDMIAELKLAGLYANRFAVSGIIRDIYTSDSIYHKVNQIQKHFGSSVYRSLAANAITRHQFKAAAAYLDTAFNMGDDKKLTVLQMSDAALECGSLYNAKKYLALYPDKKSFEYLSRKAKITDQEGDLSGAIDLMREAVARVKELNNADLLCWAKTSLADYLGHDNKIKEALGLYREVLAGNPEYYHALRGIAWIAFSHDRNTAAAEEILHFLQKVHPVPDYDLLLAQTAEYRQDDAARKKYIHAFIRKATAPEYGGMYNKYLFNLFADQLQDTDKAMAIAETEVQNRPTPESYSWLSWAYYKKGAVDKAYAIQEAYVEKKCFAPDAAWRMAVIYAEKGDTRKSAEYLKQAQASLFELGPLFEARLKKS